jgi:hypothetical protein
MAFSSKKLADHLIQELDLETDAADLKAAIDSYMKTTKPRKPRAKKEKDPNAPKRAKTAYIFFANEVRPRVKKENPEAKFGEISSIIGAEWNALSDKKKAPYVKMSENDKKRAAQEKEKYESEDSNEDEKPAKGKSSSASDESDDQESDDSSEEAPKKKAPPKKATPKAKGKGKSAKGRGKK